MNSSGYLFQFGGFAATTKGEFFENTTPKGISDYDFFPSLCTLVGIPLDSFVDIGIKRKGRMN
jgi:hypothetical protein